MQDKHRFTANAEVIAKIKFLRDLSNISPAVADWARDKLAEGRSLADVKGIVRKALETVQQDKK